jgi:hypothetical protein
MNVSPQTTSPAPLSAAAEFFASVQKDVHEAVRQLQLGRAISYARPGSVSLRLAGSDRLAIASLDSASAPEARFVGLVESDASAAEALPAEFRDAAVLHRLVLDRRPNAKAALIFRGRHLPGWALARAPVPVRYFQMFNYTKAREIPVANVDGAGALDGLRRALDANPDTPAVLLSTGDTAIWARSIPALTRLALGLEEAAQVTAIAERLGGAKPYPPGIGEAIYAALAAHS